jgi:iron complex transport system substrate-binding protein
MPRVVSLIASATEIVCALGAEASLVGRSHECDYPLSVQALPVCTEPKIDPKASGLQIDHQVKALVEQSLSVYRVHGELLRELRPDVILTQSHCEVCAVSEKDVADAVCAWTDSRPRVLSLAPQNLADVWDSLLLVGDAIGVYPRKARRVRESCFSRVQAVRSRALAIRRRPGVAFLEWVAPLMAGGNWVPELIELAGGRNLFGEAGKHSPWMTWEQLRRSDPEVIVIAPCGYDMAQTRRDLPFLTEQPEWSGLQAVQSGRVFVADGNQFFNRPGPRLVESCEILAEVLHPEAFSFGHEGIGWQRL